MCGGNNCKLINYLTVELAIFRISPTCLIHELARHPSACQTHFAKTMLGSPRWLSHYRTPTCKNIACRVTWVARHLGAPPLPHKRAEGSSSHARVVESCFSCPDLISTCIRIDLNRVGESIPLPGSPQGASPKGPCGRAYPAGSRAGGPRSPGHKS